MVTSAHLIRQADAAVVQADGVILSVLLFLILLWLIWHIVVCQGRGQAMPYAAVLECSITCGICVISSLTHHALYARLGVQHRLWHM